MACIDGFIHMLKHMATTRGTKTFPSTPLVPQGEAQLDTELRETQQALANLRHNLTNSQTKDLKEEVHESLQKHEDTWQADLIELLHRLLDQLATLLDWDTKAPHLAGNLDNLNCQGQARKRGEEKPLRKASAFHTSHLLAPTHPCHPKLLISIWTG